MRRISIPFLLVSVVTTVILIPPAVALYQWTDERGDLHITDYPPPGKGPQEPAAPVQEAVPALAAPEVKQPATVRSQPTPTRSEAPPDRMRQISTVPSATAAVKTTKPEGPAPRTAVLSPAATVPPPAGQAAPAGTDAPRPVPAPPAAPKKPMAADAAAGILAVAVGLFIAFSLYYSLCLYKIAEKLGVDGAWAAWVPIVHFYWPVVGAAAKPAWWTILLLVPVVNLFISVYLWTCISGNLGRNKWMGLLMMVPLINLVYLGMLAFSKAD
jgi:hypothetical protein